MARETVTVEEAQESLGYTTVSSVMHDLKYGRLRAAGNGRVYKDSVEELIRRHEADADRRALFLKDNLTPAERKRLAGPRVKPKK